MTIDFYHISGSPPCHAIMLLNKTLGIKMNMKWLDYGKEEHKTPEFIKINPQHTLPTIVDDGFVIAESRVILTYLVQKYAKDDSLYPKDLKKRTIIDQRLHFDLGTLYQSILDYYMFEVIYTGKSSDPIKLARVEDAFDVLNKHLEGQAWTAGNELTIADFSIAATVASAECLGHDIKKYGNVNKWFSKVKKTLPGYNEVFDVELEYLTKIFEQYKK